MVDENYCGIINVILINEVSKIFTVVKGMKITQLIVEKIVYADCELSVSLEDTERGSKSFVSNGYKYSIICKF